MIAKTAPETTRLPAELATRWRNILLGVGVAGLVLSGVGWAVDASRFYHSWLAAFTYFLSLGLGAAFFLTIFHVAGAKWNVTTRRLAEGFMSALPIMLPLFIPVLVGLHELYHWTHHEDVAADAILSKKAGYLNETFFMIRVAIYFAIWIGVSSLLWKWSRKNDETGDPQYIKKMRGFSAAFIPLLALSSSFAAFDWIMSLEPHWYSTIFGIIFFAGCAVMLYASLGAFALLLRRKGVLGDTITPEHYHDIGKLLFGFAMFWTYVSFSQFMLQWYANIPEETEWYMHRWEDAGWQTFSIALAVMHFGVPFFGLMSRHVKRNGKPFAIACVWMLFVHYMDVFWMVMPNHGHHHLSFHWIDLTALVGVGGLFLGTAVARLGSAPLVPVEDPYLPASMEFENA